MYAANIYYLFCRHIRLNNGTLLRYTYVIGGQIGVSSVWIRVTWNQKYVKSEQN